MNLRRVSTETGQSHICVICGFTCVSRDRRRLRARRRPHRPADGPLPARLAHGGRTDKGDGLFSIWVVAWVSHALTTSPVHLFDANIFYPEKETLAYSEANVGAGALGVPVWIATHNPYATHNAIILIAFALAFVAMYLLARQLVGPGTPAIVAGILFAFCPYIFGHTAHIQLLMTAGLPAAMAAMHRLVERPGPWPAIALGLVLFAQAISCGYYGILAGMLVTAGVLAFSVTRGLWRSRDWWTWVGVAAGLAIALSLPFLKHYLALTARTGFHRDLSDAAYYAANFHAWTASSAILHHWMVHEPQDWPEAIFPGSWRSCSASAGSLCRSESQRRRIDRRVTSSRSTPPRPWRSSG